MEKEHTYSDNLVAIHVDHPAAPLPIVTPASRAPQSSSTSIPWTTLQLQHRLPYRLISLHTGTLQCVIQAMHSQELFKERVVARTRVHSPTWGRSVSYCGICKTTSSILPLVAARLLSPIYSLLPRL